VKVQDDEIKFNVFEALQHHEDQQECFRIDVVDELCMV
jgi:hypothetical protein